MALATGAKLGPYELASSIGAGGMGEVYRAHDQRLGRDVAVKIIPASFASDASRVRRFEQEARAAAALNHPNILAVYDLGTHGDCPYIVSELLKGQTLRDRLRDGLLPIRKVVDYALQIARGLAAAHDRGIVHRDLKPDNIFITNEGRVKILDFGLAKLTRPDTAADEQTKTVQSDPGTVLGTVGYMSPEQVRGKETDARSDIFSFGTVLYEMISGKRAFKGDSAADVLSAILKEEPPDMTAANQNVSPGLDRVVRHCLTELLEGETLRDRVRNGALSRRRSIEYGIQIARALAAAHDKGIIHRDLKPENVFVTREGRIKILDFGLAKLARKEEVAAAAGHSAPTLTVDTTPGVVLGTVGYMSPEQVRGLLADARSDIFALGAMLYEMLSGQRAFKGQTPADTMSAILKEDPPDFAETGREISPAMERIVRHCLEKNPEERFRSAHDVAFALENVSQTSQSTVAIATAPKLLQMAALKPLLFSFALAVVAVGVFLAWRGTRHNVLPTFRRLTFERGMILSARFAADGKNAIYGASWESSPVRLFSTPFDSPQARPLELESASLLGFSRSVGKHRNLFASRKIGENRTQHSWLAATAMECGWSLALCHRAG